MTDGGGGGRLRNWTASFPPSSLGLSLLIGRSPRKALLPVSAPRAHRGSKVGWQGFVLTRSWHRGARCGFRGAGTPRAGTACPSLPPPSHRIYVIQAAWPPNARARQSLLIIYFPG